MLTRICREEDGFALVTAVAIMAIMTVLLVVVLQAGNSAFTIAERNSRYTRTLGVAEAGLDDAVTQLGEARGFTSSCPTTGTAVCTASGGEYQVDWSQDQSGNITVTSIGYYPSRAGAKITREIQAVYQPVPIVNYAIFSDTSITIKNGQVVYGDVFANQGVTLGSGAVICGSITAAGDAIDAVGAHIVKSYADTTTGKTCTGKSGNAWADGTVDLGSTGVVEGDATASAPASAAASCAANWGSYAVLGGTVQGTATACGKITSAAGTSFPGKYTSPAPPKKDPAGTGMYPPFVFDPSNYTSITCIPASNPCNPSSTSALAYQTFNDPVAYPKTNMKGVYAVWQTSPACSQIASTAGPNCTKLDLSGLTVGGDLTIITNAPVDFGNTATITANAPARVVIVSLYVPNASSTCSGNSAGDCSIYGKNSIVFDAGDPNNLNDGISALLYTPGKCAFKQQFNAADGALYCGSIDVRNGFTIAYNPRVAQVAGFGGILQQVSWKEIS